MGAMPPCHSLFLFHLLFSAFVDMPVVRCEGTVISRDTTQVVFGGVANHLPYQKNGVHDETDLVNLNLQLYKGILTSGANEKASFVVFPEFGLAPFGTKNRTSLMLTAEKISTISIGTYPCDSFTSEQQLGFPILYQMACFSRDAQIAGLVNMIDLVPCSAQTDNACPSMGSTYITQTLVYLQRGNSKSCTIKAMSIGDSLPNSMFLLSLTSRHGL